MRMSLKREGSLAFTLKKRDSMAWIKRSFNSMGARQFGDSKRFAYLWAFTCWKMMWFEIGRMPGSGLIYCEDFNYALTMERVFVS